MNILMALKAINTAADTTHPESTIVQTAQWMVQSGHIYPAIAAPPYTPAPYGPLFYLGLAAIGHVANGGYELRLLLRAIAFGSYILTGLVAYSLARRLGTSKSAGILGGAMTLAAPFVAYWNVSARPDFPALLLSLLAIWVIALAEAPAYRSVLLAAIFCACAVLIKQSFIAAPLAIALLLVLSRRFWLLVTFVTTGLLAASLAVAYLLYRGEPVVTSMLIIGRSPLAIKPGLALFYSGFPLGLGVLLLVGACAGSALAANSDRWQFRILCYYFFFSAAITLLTLLQVGSDSNYMFEFWAVASILAVIVIPQGEAIWSRFGQPLKLGIALAMGFLAIQSLHAISHPGTKLTNYNYDKLHDLHVLSTDPSLTIRGKNPEFLDAFLATILQQRGVWSPSGIIAEIQKQQFDVIFVQGAPHIVVGHHGQAFLSASIVQSINDSYQPLCRTSTMLVMVPRRVGPERFSASDGSSVLGETCDTVPENAALFVKRQNVQP